MRTSQFPLNTVKEIPADAVVISHQLMLRAGLIRKLAAGLYTWLPLGLRVLRKVEAIVREEMDKAGALEVLMPALQPAELWQETGRWEKYGPELARLKDRHDRDFCLGPTHEEIITDLARNEIKSYKQLPIMYYQIQTKFRDEIRPRFGVMRCREFIMKDAYSFHLNQESLQATYELMHRTYTTIFTRFGLKFRAVIADSGSIGGAVSHEFHVLADSGEDAIAFSDGSDYAANIEKAEACILTEQRKAASEDLTQVNTSDRHSIEEISLFLKVPANNCLKTLIVKGDDNNLVAARASVGLAVHSADRRCARAGSHRPPTVVAYRRHAVGDGHFFWRSHRRVYHFSGFVGYDRDSCFVERNLSWDLYAAGAGSVVGRSSFFTQHRLAGHFVYGMDDRDWCTISRGDRCQSLQYAAAGRHCKSYRARRNHVTGRQAGPYVRWLVLVNDIDCAVRGCSAGNVMD